MKSLLTGILFICLVPYLRGQVADSLPAAANSRIFDTVSQHKPGDLNLFHSGKPEFHVMAGSEFSTASGYGSGLTEYIIPQVSYPLGKRFVVSGGIAVMNTNYFNAKPLFYNENTQGYNGNYTSVTLFASGKYFVNDRFIIGATVYKEFPAAGKPLTYSPYNPVSQQGAEGFHVNAQYKIGQHMFIEAGFGMKRGGYDYFNSNPYSPYHSNGIGSFGGMDPFGTFNH